MSTNPFNVRNPEHVDAEYIAENFVDVFTDFPRLQDAGNTFIHGARGTGKSMLLRSLEPRVMMLRLGRGTTLTSLPFLAVHVPLRRTEFAAPELTRSHGYAGTALGEHLLVMQVMLRIATLLHNLAGEIESKSARIFFSRFEELYRDCGGNRNTDCPLDAENAAIFLHIARICEMEAMAVRQYYVRSPFQPERTAYNGALTGFLDFLAPLASAVRQISGLPNVPLFVMLDDADNLPKAMQRVLNSWVSSRSTSDVCLKITTQLAYATRRTLDNRVIESPHDFAEVNLSSVYTSDYGSYSDRVRKIISKRLANVGCNEDVDIFFPRDERQAQRLAEIQAEIDGEHAARIDEGLTNGRRGAARARDERTRYAVPRLMRELTGSSRSGHTYSYAGFKSLVDLSSGVVRWFLEPASRMYDSVVSEGQPVVAQIPVAIQDKVVREWSTEFLESLVPSPDSEDADPTGLSSEEASLHALGHETESYTHLRNLVEALGRLFRSRLLDGDISEQRVISIVLRDTPTKKLKEVLDLGVRLGYLQRSDNAAKEALGGRKPRYVLAKRLGPHYRLDVSGYAAHLSVTSSDLALALDDPAIFVRRRAKQDDHPMLPLDL
ncbi:hypothetical protein DK419_25820 [Methylobacterium terrae]|uniref:Orc1-like AAA ATPase domain-containing protein n=1 Tax=Methylobacterium terrae TaxID=2202827 RepID=A0A2U8WY72_9HYPH|nr:hypothetical protein [Methylobacterium terrae]AWN50252.1 hypothetical protein DK419_25820 [Methylobacterium terrae]